MLLIVRVMLQHAGLESGRGLTHIQTTQFE
jgi:hypothetical protein